MIFKKIFVFLPNKKKIVIILFFFFMVITSLAEIISIASLIPFLAVITSPERLFNFELLIPLYNYFNIDSKEELLFPVTILFMGTAIFSGVCRTLLLHLSTKLTGSITAFISFRVYDIYLKNDYIFHISTSKEAMVDMIVNKSNTSIRTIVLAYLTAASSITILSSIVIALFFYNWIITLASISFFFIIFLIIEIFTREKTKQNNKVVSEYSSLNLRLIVESMRSIKDVIISGTTNYFLKNFYKLNTKIKLAHSSNIFISQFPKFLIESLGMVVIAIFAYQFAIHGRSEDIIAVLGVFVLSSQKLLPMMQKIFTSFKQIKQNSIQANLVINIIENHSDTNHFNLRTRFSKKNLLPFKKNIEFKNVEFSYNDKEIIFGKGLNFKINKGDRVAISGNSGSGKTTLVDIIMGLLAPRSGQILIDSIPLTQENKQIWQNKISHVPQDLFISKTTVSENIAFGIPKASIDVNKVKKICKVAQLHEFIMTLPKNYDTIIGAGGRVLSGGQIQRVGIARALYRDAELIILDESTNALDYETETQVLKDLFKLPKKITILVIAHSENSFLLCNKRFNINRGSLSIYEN